MVKKINDSPHFNVVLLGKTGCGKSASGNTILGREDFVSKLNPKSVTKVIASENVTIGEVSLTVFDTPGLFDTGRGIEEIQNQWQDVLQLEQSGSTVFMVVIRPDRFTEEETKTVEVIEEFLGESRRNKTWLLFTRGDDLEYNGTTVEEYIQESPELMSTVQRWDHRYHVFNNRNLDNRGQVTTLIEKIRAAFPVTSDTPSPHLTSVLPERRLMLLGKTGVGKSASGNTILGHPVFESETNFNGVTKQSELQKSVVAGREVSVIDTPGLLDPQKSQEELAIELGRSIYLANPGVHALLIVIQIGRFTESEKKVIDMIITLFGEEALKYAIILFTHGDELKKDIGKLIKENKALSDVVQWCGGRYHILDNKNKTNRAQVTALLKKVDTMVKENGGNYYTNEMFQDAINNDFLKQQKEKEEQEERRHQEEQQIQDGIDRVRRETEERVRQESEEERRSLQNIINSQKTITNDNQLTDTTRPSVSAEGSPESEPQNGEMPQNIAADISDNTFVAFLKKHWKKLSLAAAIVVVVGGVAGGVVSAVLPPVGVLTAVGVGAAVGAGTNATILVGGFVWDRVRHARNRSTSANAQDEEPLLPDSHNQQYGSISN